MSDEEAIGATIDEMYAMISGPAGPRDWSRQEKCLAADAVQVRTWVDENGRAVRRKMTLDEYAGDTQPFFDHNDFDEVETRRNIQVFGNIAHVWSAYEAGPIPGGQVAERSGINSIQLFNDPARGWRIVHMIWDNER